MDTLAGLYVLVVHPRHDPSSVLCSILRYAGALVNAADSVAAALDTMRLVKPDLLVVDCEIGDASAWDLIAAVRALKPERGGVVPAIAIGTSPAQADEARLRGYDGFIAQPVEPRELARIATGLIPPS